MANTFLINFCSFTGFCLVFGGYLILNSAVADAHSYVTTDGRFYRLESPKLVENVTDWKECEEKCRQHHDCRTFLYGAHQEGRVCRFSENRLVYGPLTGDGLVSGELESFSENASLVWAGIGYPYPRVVGPYVNINPNNTNISHAQCQAECDSIEADMGVKCVSYRTNSENGKCATYSTALQVKESNEDPATKFGIREDINLNETAIVGDPLGTRIPPNEFPPAPPDIGDLVPGYKEIDFHYEKGLEEWKILAKCSGSLTKTVEECSTECHQTTDCVAFFFYIAKAKKTRKCCLYDALLLGRVEPGFEKYGVIDRSKGEGAVMSLVNAETANGHSLYLEKEFIKTMDECAKLCYRFYQPKMCIGFFFDLPNKECKLYDAVPAVAEGQIGRPIAFDAQYEWNAEKYRFAYLDDRITADMRAIIKPMIISKVTTDESYRTKAGVCRNSTASMETKLRVSGGETDVQLQLLCVHQCFTKRQWCLGYQVERRTRRCRIYATAVKPSDAGKNTEGCIYAEKISG